MAASSSSRTTRSRRTTASFPASEAVIQACGDELTPHLFGSGTIRFPADKPIPVALVTKILEVRWAENAAAERR